MSCWVESLRGMVFPVHCDHLNHVNNRWYGHFFDDATMAFWSLSGLVESEFATQYGVMAVQVKNVIEFHHELLGGDQFVVRSAFTRIGNKSVTSQARLSHAGTETLCATYSGISVFVDAPTH